MAVAHDASSESHTGTTGSVSEASFTWNHTPAGTPRGVLVFTGCGNASGNQATAVTYGGVALTAVASSLAADTAGEQGSVRAWFLGKGIPTSTQAVVVTRLNNSAECYAVAITVTAGDDTEVTGVTLQQEDQAPAEASIDDGSIGINSLRYAAAHYGGSGVPGAGANSTAIQSIDFGLHTFGVVRETTAGQGSRAVGFSAASDDWACTLLAIREVKALTPGLFTNSATFYAPTITPGAVDLSPGLFTNSQTFYAPTVVSTYALTPGLVTNSQTFHAPAASATYTLAPALFTNSQTFFAADVAAAGGEEETPLHHIAGILKPGRLLTR